MNFTTTARETRLQRLAVPILAIAALITSGCGSDSDEPDVEESPHLTNVQPVGAARTPNPADVPLPPQDDDDRPPAISGEQAPAESMESAEQHIYATAKIAPASGSNVSGEIGFRQDGEEVRIQGTLTGLEPGKHGLHVHAVGDCSAPDASSAKGHFAPDGDPHGAPEEPADLHHVGDLGNVMADAAGIAQINKSDAEMSLQTGDKSIIGRAMIVHAKADDLTSQPSGAAGARVGCGVIEIDVSQAYQPAAETEYQE